MSLLKPEIAKLSGDFSLWKMKMRALLVHQGLESVLEEEDLDKETSFKPDEKKKHI